MKGGEWGQWSGGEEGHGCGDEMGMEKGMRWVN